MMLVDVHACVSRKRDRERRVVLRNGSHISGGWQILRTVAWVNKLETQNWVQFQFGSKNLKTRKVNDVVAMQRLGNSTLKKSRCFVQDRRQEKSWCANLEALQQENFCLTWWWNKKFWPFPSVLSFNWLVEIYLR